MRRERVLLVEDDLWYSKFLNQTLAKEGIDLTVLSSGEEFFQIIQTGDFDAVVLDLGLPDEDGIVLARKLRARSKLPIIIVTGREELDDKLASFDVGADDYLTKPVEPKELAARIRAVIRRADNTSQANDNIFKLGPHTLDMEQRTVFDAQGTAADLTPAEFSLLAILCQAKGNVISRDTLIDSISAGEGPLSSRAIDTLISRIRKKLGKGIVETVTGFGYRISTPDS